MASFKKPTRPKYKAMPKAPKVTASSDVWKRYEQRVKAVSAENQKRKADYEKKLKAYETEVKMRENIKAKAQSAKAKLQ